MYTGETEMLPIQRRRSVTNIERTNRYLYRERGGVTYTEETEPLSIQGKGTVIYTGEDKTKS